ncbi:hypothetical protein [Actinoplanes sp. NPDC026619]
MTEPTLVRRPTVVTMVEAAVDSGQGAQPLHFDAGVYPSPATWMRRPT